MLEGDDKQDSGGVTPCSRDSFHGSAAFLPASLTIQEPQVPVPLPAFLPWGKVSATLILGRCECHWPVNPQRADTVMQDVQWSLAHSWVSEGFCFNSRNSVFLPILLEKSGEKSPLGVMMNQG